MQALSEDEQSPEEETDEAPTSPARPWRRRLRPLIVPAVYTLMCLAVFWRMWTPIDNAQRIWKYDPPHDYWGDMIFQQDTLRDGELALWNPHDRGGFPVYGDPQPGMLYPPNWPLLLWDFGDSLPFSAASLKIFLHWIFGAIGMHLLLRRFGAKEPACYVAGALFSFTSPKLRYMGSALNWSVAWIPWVLLAVDWFAEKPTIKRAVVMGSALAMVLLSGAPAVVLYTLLLALPFGIYRMRGKIIANWKPIAAGAGVTLLWILPLMAGNLEQLPESVRETRSYAFITDSVFTPGHLLSFMVPRLGGENPYVGACAILGLGLAITCRKNRGLAWIFLGVAGLAVAVSFGRHAGVLPFAASAFPPFSMFRRAHRYLYITSLAIAIIAGIGISNALSLEAGEQRQRIAKIITWIGCALTFALGIAYLVSIVVHDKQGATKNVGFGLAFLSAAVFTVFLRFAMTSNGKTRQWFAWALPLLVFLDIWTANYPFAEIGVEAMPRTPNDQAVAKLEGIDRDWRVFDDGFLMYRPGVRLGIRDFSGYEDDPLGLSRYKSLLNASKRDMALMGHANVRYFLDGPKGKLAPNKKHADKIAPNIWELKKVAPAVYYVPAPLKADSPRAALKALRTFDAGTNAVVEGQVSPGAADLPVTAGTITHFSPNAIRAEIETPGPGLIIVSEAYYPKWSATLDGSQADILPANLLFRGIAVDSAGQHVIEMKLRPMRFWGLLPAFVLAMVLLLWAVLPRRRQLKAS